MFISFRYGWSSETCNKTDEQPSPSTPGITSFPNVEPQNIFNNRRENGKQMFGLDSLTQVTDPPLSEHTPPDGPVESAAVCFVKIVLFFSLVFGLKSYNHGIHLDNFCLTRRRR